MSRLLTLFGQGTTGGGIIVPTRYVTSGNRNRAPIFRNTTQNGNTVRHTRVFHKTPLLYALKYPQATYGNWVALSAGGEGSSGLKPFRLRASIELPGVGFYQLLFGGQIEILVNPGDTVKSDPLDITLPNDTVFFVRTYRYYQDTGGAVYDDVANVYLTQGSNAFGNKGDGVISGNDPDDDRTMGGTITAVPSVTQGYGPILVSGELVGTGANILIIGDSIPSGTGDGSGGTARGDFLSGTSPTAPYVNIGDVGWVERGLAGQFALLNIAVPGRSATGFTRANAAKLFAIVDQCPPTHLILTTGVNDLLSSSNPVTAEQLLVRNENIMANARADWGVEKCLLATIGPVAASSDAWTTLGNQSLTGMVAGIANPNWGNFTDNTQTTGRSRYNHLLRTGQSSADAIIDKAVTLQDATDERYWNTTGGNARTSDGLHENQTGHTEGSASIDKSEFGATVTPLTNRILLESGDGLLMESGDNFIVEN